MYNKEKQQDTQKYTYEMIVHMYCGTMGICGPVLMFCVDTTVLSCENALYLIFCSAETIRDLLERLKPCLTM